MTTAQQRQDYAQNHTQNRARDNEPVSVRAAVDAATHGRHGGWFATAFSAVAVVVSGLSVYISALQAAQLEVHLAPAFQYAMDGEGENFTIPITIANSGARSGTVISMELEVENAKTKVTQRFYSAYLGEHPQMQARENLMIRQFAPMAVLGHAVLTETVRFYPVGLVRRDEGTPRIVSGAGDYIFRLKVNTAAPAEPTLLDGLLGPAQPPVITAQMVLPVLDHRGIMRLHGKGWKALAKP